MADKNIDVGVLVIDFERKTNAECAAVSSMYIQPQQPLQEYSTEYQPAMVSLAIGK
jgi:hypothetical protein